MLENVTQTMREMKRLIQRIKAAAKKDEKTKYRAPHWRSAEEKYKGRGSQLREGFKRAIGK